MYLFNPVPSQVQRDGADVVEVSMYLLQAMEPLATPILPPHLDLLSAMSSCSGDGSVGTSSASGNLLLVAAPTDGAPDHPVISKLARQTYRQMPEWAQKSCSNWIHGIGAQGLRVASIYTGSDFCRTAIEAFLRSARPAHLAHACDPPCHGGGTHQVETRLAAKHVPATGAPIVVIHVP